ncbi:rRNA (cytosine-C(5)-)-methyltransferase RsmF [Psychromonas sp. CNPT3]|uniref:16S rRNA (cytosine(1407)-C(5))-methyltransferase RsmF n=1 Tax=Psychromonas sp. CNPT3 TaxID=314282 RepID=UPI00006E489F|nr:16S rRNA (cytosine(1407)-C(5))-methyltransferase RsmF [Psychromonas sp. CNPT3]AGH80968.1 rRNA (cytosine-C(5)-)-methyltransferase RsmF [Psychromonas sp. CNPT3]
MDNRTLLPPEFINKMSDILPKTLALSDFLDACQRPLRPAVRVNTLKISIDDFKLLASEHNWQLSSIPWCTEGFWIDAGEQLTPLGNSFEHLSGLCYLQEASSMLPVSALSHFFKTDEHSTILDMAAAPGSKTTQLAAQMNNQGLLIANEYSASRVKILHANMQRCGIKNVALTHFDGKIFGSWLENTFDAILLDAPCSGEGTVRKDKHAMKNWSQSSIESIALTQQALIESAFYALKEDGILVYSTCTLSLEENQDICHALKERFTDCVEFLNLSDLFKGADKAATTEGFLHVWPQIYDTEGFFVAAIRKVGKTTAPSVKKRLGKFPFIRPTRQKEAELYEYFETQFGITNITGMLYQRDQEFWLFPDPIKALIPKIRFSRLGIKIAEEFGSGRKSGFKSMHEFLTCFGAQATKNVLILNAEQAQTFYQGRDIRELHSEIRSGEVLLSYRNTVIGFGKVLNNRIKNNLPRELIRDNNIFTK